MHYASPVAEWERWVEVRNAEGWPEASLSTPSMPVVAGKTISDRWFGGPVATSLSPLLAKYGWGLPYRWGDYMWLYPPSFVDDAGHVGGPIFLGEFEGKLYQDGELVLQADDPIWMQTVSPPSLARLPVRLHDASWEPFSQRSTMSETTWQFRSQAPEGDHEVVSLLSVDYDLGLTKYNSASPGAFAFGVKFAMPPEVDPGADHERHRRGSWDKGATWARQRSRAAARGLHSYGAEHPEQVGIASRYRHRRGQQVGAPDVIKPTWWVGGAEGRADGGHLGRMA